MRALPAETGSAVGGRPVSNVVSSPSRRLDSWKAISQYLGRDERTVRRWEKESGFPIHRVPGGRGSSVFAYESEIDEWLRVAGPATASPAPVEPPVPARAAAPAPPLSPPVSWSVGRWASISLIACAALAAIAILAFRRGEIPDGLSIRTTGDAVVAQRPDGSELWHYVLPEHADWGASPAVMRGAKPAVFVASANHSRQGSGEYLNGRLMEFDFRGNLRRTFEFDDRLRFSAGEFTPPWVITDFKVDDRNGSRRIAVSAHHYLQWPSVVTILDEQARRLGSFVNAGWVLQLQWLQPNRLLASGFSNEHDGGMLTLLDATVLDGKSPTSGTSEYNCVGCHDVFPLKYIVLGRSEVNRVTASQFNGAIVELQGDRILVRTIEVPFDGRSGAAQALYEFSASLELVAASYSDHYWEEHRRLEAQGTLHHSADKCPERTPNHVKAYEVGTGWRDLSIRN